MSRPVRTKLWLLCILVAGFALRCALAAHPGHGWDSGIMQEWMQSAAQLGLAHSYGEQVHGNLLPQYPPVLIGILGLSGQLYRLLVSSSYEVIQPLHLLFFKLPSLLADLGIAMLLWRFISRRKGRRAGLIAAAVYAFHPAVFHNSAVWGQVDALYAFFLVAACLAFTDKRYGAGAFLAVLSVGAKPQALILLPLFAFLVPWRLRLALNAFNGAAAALALMLFPFVLDGNIDRVIHVFTAETAFHYTRLSWNAYNFWWVLIGPPAWDTNAITSTVGPYSYKAIGLGLFAAVYATVLWRMQVPLRSGLRMHKISVFAAASVICMGFFLFNAAMHERYLYAFLPLALPLAFENRRYAVLYACVSAAYLLNNLAVISFGAWDAALIRAMPTLGVVIGTLLLVAFWRLCVMAFSYRHVPYASRSEQPQTALPLLPRLAEETVPDLI